MANKTLSDFKTRLIGGGARPNLFEVRLNGPIPGADDFDAETFQFLCKAAALPASNIAPIDVPFRGRIFKVAGDRTFDTWTITVINDEGFEIRNAMEQWMQFIGQYGDSSGATEPGSYMKSANVLQLKRSRSNTGTAVYQGEGYLYAANYQFVDIFPTNISAIDLSYDTSDTIEEFTVEFQVQYWVPLGKDNDGVISGSE
tara:strand:- start:695 stop:1294 length:600 start_codon:yes stop_codon:yes gene_type:complete